MESREHLVEQVAKTLQENHGKHQESYIFGISGKWGEGKTRFLNDLSQELEGKFQIARINPWKFATDKVSFLRNFLKSLAEINETHVPNNDLKESKNKVGKFPHTIRISIRNNISRLKGIIVRDKFQALYYDTSKNSINWRVLLSLTFTLSLLLIAYFYWISPEFKNEHIDDLNRFQLIIAVAAAPLLVTLLGKTIIIKRASRSISTLDKFDDLLEKVISDFKGRNVLVFVDDLDRVTPQTAREVLDNLRTFFDRKELSFEIGRASCRERV